MKVEFVPLEASLLQACAEFNQRLRVGASEPPFTLPEQLSEAKHWVAVDAEGAVRGGVLLQTQPAWLNGQPISAINVQSPLSEGIVNRKYSMLGLQMLGFLASQSPYLYAVGMGSLDNPFAKLLAASKWQVELVPFYFSVVDGNAFLREIGPLRKRATSRLAATLGLGNVGAKAWRWSHAPSTHGYSLEATGKWDGLDQIWAESSPSIGFGLLRNSNAIEGIFPASDARLHRFVLKRNGSAVGWTAAYITRQAGSQHFGSLNVATILDGMAAPKHLPALLALTRNALADQSAQLVILNQSHQDWHNPLMEAGFFSGPSNYVAACSRAISATRSSMHITRADGDGRIHL